MSLQKESPEESVTLPDNASPWLKQAFESALLQNPHAALFDAKKLLALLRKRNMREIAAHSLEESPATWEVEWKEIGDVHVFASNTDKSQICELGRDQGWHISVVKCRKTGRMRAMSMSRLS